MTVLAGPVDGLWLRAADLLSKWGFGDGRLPDELLEWLAREDPAAHDDAVWYRLGELVDAWPGVLVGLVRARLLPVLDHQVGRAERLGLNLVTGMGHNPARAELVDGADVTECWYGRQPDPVLTPAGVLVPWPDVWAALAAAVGSSPVGGRPAYGGRHE